MEFSSTTDYQTNVHVNWIYFKSIMLSYAVDPMSTFFSLGKQSIRTSKQGSSDVLFSYGLRLDNVKFAHYAVMFTPFEMLGGIAGVFELLIMLIGLFLYPLSEHNFYWSVAKRMFLARTDQDRLF